MEKEKGRLRRILFGDNSSSYDDANEHEDFVRRGKIPSDDFVKKNWNKRRTEYNTFVSKTQTKTGPHRYDEVVNKEHYYETPEGVGKRGSKRIKENDANTTNQWLGYGGSQSFNDDGSLDEVRNAKGEVIYKEKKK